MSERRIPFDLEEFLVFAREVADAFVEKGGNDEFLTETGASLLEKVETIIEKDIKAKEYAALKKRTNQEKWDLKHLAEQELSRAIHYLEFKLGKTSLQLENFNIRPRKG